MALSTTLNVILVGGLLGAFGQIIRVIVGLKKLNENQKEAKTTNTTIDIARKATPGTSTVPVAVPEFSWSRFWYSIIIGFVAGALAGLFVQPLTDESDKNAYASIIAAGYAGTDFIEGFMSKILPKNQPANTPLPPAE
jgi:hypothetical protein